MILYEGTKASNIDGKYNNGSYMSKSECLYQIKQRNIKIKYKETQAKLNHYELIKMWRRKIFQD